MTSTGRLPLRIRFTLLPREKLLIGCCLLLLPLLAAAVAPGRPLAALDAAILSWLGGHLRGAIGDGLTQVYRVSGVGVTAVLVVMALLHLVLRHWWRDLSLLASATGGILILVDLVFKPLFSRLRPPGSLLPLDGHSFPSGHAAGAVAFYFAMVVILSAHHPRQRRPLTLLACLWVGLVWLSTLYVRAHWPTDLLGGAALGVAWLTLCVAFWRDSPRMQPRRMDPATSDPGTPPASTAPGGTGSRRRSSRVGESA